MDNCKHRRTDAGPARSKSQRVTIAYGVTGIFALAALIGCTVFFSVARSGKSGNAHINQATGSTNGLLPDTRIGVHVLPVKVQNLDRAARLANCELRLRLKDEGHKHIAPTAATPNYKTNPPTSGSHVEAPYQQADGAYREMPAEIDFVHSLEHGRLEIQYKPNLAEKRQLELLGVYDTMYGATLLFPNNKMPYAVAATTWRNLLGCVKYRGQITLDAIRDFGKTTWGRYGGQPVDTFERIAPTPYEPSTK